MPGLLQIFTSLKVISENGNQLLHMWLQWGGEVGEWVGRWRMEEEEEDRG